MNIVKKVLAFVLALAVLCVPLSAFAAPNSSGDDYPFIFVHGLGGWGFYDKGYEDLPYWGGGAAMTRGDGDFMQFLNDNGYEAYAASVGPVNSAWDRACELYAQLTGTVVDYGEAHSKAHNHDRYGRSYVGQALMGEPWNFSEPINLVGHSFGGPAVRMFTSLMAFGDEAELAATGKNTSPLFKGGHSKSVHSVITLSGCHNGSPLANLIVDTQAPMVMIGAAMNLLGAAGINSMLFYSDLALGHFGLMPKYGESEAVDFSLYKILNFVASKDNAGYDLTVGGSQELNEKIKMSPDTYYYSYSVYITGENEDGRQVRTHDCALIFKFTTGIVCAFEGLTVDGIKMTKEWAINDGMVPLISALYPLDEADNAYPYEESAKAGTVKKGSWYYLEPIYGMDHGDFCGTTDNYPEGGYEKFYLDLAELATCR